ncbi:succinic semialdehyde dehydrogenase [Schizophyllum commune H4-8]|uniref:succinic semialdehyde dehydrogenase n=1 Tax=Schizophyllum commune (strain H4-8 / FGSC 9210) TaxID=578458 RepID=UPI0021601C2E|nr:succinic semialdehyde dehydrogenase [Schizophyllum commune H4-8]KAI5893611.1 succinic semialdehyde dehydrogenase [Schizophyllum commune H4-8]
MDALIAQNEEVASEVEVLKSIYGDECIKPWTGEGAAASTSSAIDGGKAGATIRYQVALPLLAPHEDVTVDLLVSLPPDYPEVAPPQLQLLSRYIGPFKADSDLFGRILRTYISVSGVDFIPGLVCVFDGVQHILEHLTQWYEEHLSAEKAGDLQRELEKEAHAEQVHASENDASRHAPRAILPSREPPPPLPEGTEIFEAEPIVDRKSVFIGRAVRITHPSQVPVIIANLLEDRKTARAAHPTIHAWRCQVGTVLHQDNDDDGETAAGGRLAHLLQIMEINNVLVVVTSLARLARLAGSSASRLSVPATLRMASTKAAAADPSLVKTQGLINGKWLDAQDGQTISVTNPATFEELATVPDMGAKETEEAIKAAEAAFPAWSKTTAKYRHDLLMKLFALMKEHTDDLGRMITLENGKTLTEAKGEVTYSASFLEWFAEEAVRTYGQTIPCAAPGTRNITIRQPVGASVLTPWNFPSAMITRKLGAALAAGCTTVIKPAHETPFSALALGELANRAGIPDGVINIVTTQSNVSDVGKLMCESPAVRKVTFTGSTNVAKLLYGMSASTLKKISLEAGGNAPFIVFDDADIDAAVEGAIASKFRGSGQTCVCANRIYVQSSVYADFASRLAARIAQFKPGNGLEEGVTHGPLIHQRAVEKVKEHVEDAIAKGAQVMVGGRAVENTNIFWPTLLSDVPVNAKLNSEETFGPLAALTQFETEDEVVKLANNVPVGLAGYFFSRDVGRIWRVAEKLEVGMVGVNTGLISQSCAPFGGIKESGLGREGGSEGIHEYMNTKLIVLGGLDA